VFEVIELRANLLVDEPANDVDDGLLFSVHSYIGYLLRLSCSKVPPECITASPQEVARDEGEDEIKRWSIRVAIHWDWPTATAAGATHSHSSEWNWTTKSTSRRLRHPRVEVVDRRVVA